ncbi:MAG TPA: hypothetical protein VF487_09515 [Chitinophagaceae bacterium]
MKTKTFTPMGALHPILFFAGVYVVVLLFSIFICSVLFYSCNSSSAGISKQNMSKEKPVMSGTATTAAVVLR